MKFWHIRVVVSVWLISCWCKSRTSVSEKKNTICDRWKSTLDWYYALVWMHELTCWCNSECWSLAGRLCWTRHQLKKGWLVRFKKPICSTWTFICQQRLSSWRVKLNSAIWLTGQAWVFNLKLENIALATFIISKQCSVFSPSGSESRVLTYCMLASYIYMYCMLTHLCSSYTGPDIMKWHFTVVTCLLSVLW